jgi:hypothetical protein
MSVARPQADRTQALRRQAGAVALPTDDHNLHVVVDGLLDAGLAERVQAPLQHRPVDDQRAGDLALLPSLGLGAGVDD